VAALDTLIVTEELASRPLPFSGCAPKLIVTDPPSSAASNLATISVGFLTSTWNSPLIMTPFLKLRVVRTDIKYHIYLPRESANKNSSM
jgi:hypothetical protein